MSGDKHTRDRFEWLDRVLADRELQHVTFKVAYKIATHINRLNGEAFPSFKTIAAAIGTTRRTAIRSVNELCERGHLEKRRVREKSNRYSITSGEDVPSSVGDTHVTTGDTHVTTENATSDTHVTTLVTPVSPGWCHPCHPNPLTEPFENEPFEGDIYPSAPEALKETPRQEDHSASFEEFWTVYPLHVAKGAARKAFGKALKTASAATIIAGARRYATARAGQDPKFTKHAATWLNAECWTDETPAAGGGSIIDPSGNILGQAENPDRFRPRTPGQQREDDINTMMNAALRRATS